MVSKSGYRAVFGGDLNLTPPDAPSDPVPDALAPVYDAYEECDQSANGESGDSDHKPIYATIALAAA